MLDPFYVNFDCRKVVHFAEIDLKLTSLAGRDQAQEANRKFSYVAAAHSRSPASPTSSGVDFSQSGLAHLHAGRRLSLPRPVTSGLTLEID